MTQRRHNLDADLPPGGGSQAVGPDPLWMQRALSLAARGEGHVEPNPMVGCVLVRDQQRVGEGWHQRLGGPHAEIEALSAAGDAASRATAYVTLEPCSHHGRTPPCADALIAANVKRVVAAIQDPFPDVAGRGLQRLRDAGIQVEVGLLADPAEQLMAPYLRRVRDGRPWVIAKWAMTLDGKLATAAGDSQWISNEASRRRVHQLRGRMDAILVGSGTALADDPQLTARPAGPRRPLRIVCDRRLRTPTSSQLLQTASEAPVLIATSETADATRRTAIERSGAEVLPLADGPQFLERLFAELGRRELTNVLVEGGAQMLGALFDAQLIDEVWVFVAPKLIGGVDAPSPLGGRGRRPMSLAATLRDSVVETLDDNLLIRGRL